MDRMPQQNSRASPRLRFTEDELEGASSKETSLGKKSRLVEKSVSSAAQSASSVGSNAIVSFNGNPSAASFRAALNSNKGATSAASSQSSIRSKHSQPKKSKPPSKLRHTVEKPIRTAGDQFHRQIAKANDEDNIGADAALQIEETSRETLHMGADMRYSYKLKKARRIERREKHRENAGTNAENSISANVTTKSPASMDNTSSSSTSRSTSQASPKERDTPQFRSNPYSRWQQKRTIKKGYASVKNGRQAASQTRRAAQGVADKAKSALATLRENPKVWLIGMLVGLLLFVMSGLQSCTPLAQSVLESIVIGTYPAEEEDVRAAERAYAAKEKELEKELADYERYHPGYDEYIVEADDIWHDPYVLIAIISAVYDGEDWDMDKAMPVIEKYFALQYVVTEKVSHETRYATERRTGTRTITDSYTGQTRTETYTYTVDVPYTYTICHVTMENRNLSHLPVLSMSHHTMGMYALYMATHGNMEGIFRGNPHATPLRDPMLYDIPQETLDADPTFAILMEEAEKYIGYPYVWGGDSPETSFDCSGFVSYVFTNSGVYNTGRLGATGLHNLCRNVSTDQAQPGDIVFFEGTMGEDVEGITHCGIYVGNNRMIHCGSPIGYADLTESYWRKHFHSFGRVPGR